MSDQDTALIEVRTSYLEKVETCSSVHRPLPLEPSRRLYQQPWSAVRCALKSAQIQDHRSETERLMCLRRDWLIPRMLRAIESHDIVFVTFVSSADVRTTTGRKVYNPHHGYQSIEQHITGQQCTIQRE